MSKCGNSCLILACSLADIYLLERNSLFSWVSWAIPAGSSATKVSRKSNSSRLLSKQIDPHWLRFGEERFGSVREQEAKWEIGMTQEDRDMISRFLELPLVERKTIRRFFDAYIVVSNHKR